MENRRLSKHRDHDGPTALARLKGKATCHDVSIATVVLWLFVIVLGIEIGGGLYETLVVMPLWSAAPPGSVLAYYQQNVANPQFVLAQGERFGMYSTPLKGLLAVASLISALKTRRAHRKWRTIGTLLANMVVLFTFAWFVPNIILLTGKGIKQLNLEQVTTLTNWWVRLNWVLAVLYVMAWLAALRTVSIPSCRDANAAANAKRQSGSHETAPRLSRVFSTVIKLSSTYAGLRVFYLNNPEANRMPMVNAGTRTEIATRMGTSLRVN